MHAMPVAAVGLGGATVSADASSLLCPQTTVRDYNRFLVQSLEAGDMQRRALIKRLDELSNSLAPLGDVRNELAARTKELHESQRIVTEQALAVQEEREKAARLVAENYTLMSELDDCHHKISALLQMRMSEVQALPNQGKCPIMVQIPRAADKLQPSTAAAKNSSAAAGCNIGPHSTSPPVATLSLRSVAFGPIDGNVSSTAMKKTTAGNMMSPASTPGEDPSRLSSGGRTEAHGVPTATNSSGSATQQQQQQQQQQAIVASTPPGSTLVASLAAEVKTLTQLLDEQRVAYERDRGQRIADARKQEHELHNMLRAHSATIDSLNQQLHTAVSELCVFRHDTQILERQLRGEIEILTARAAEAERLLAVERGRRSVDVQSAVDSQSAKLDHVTAHVRSRLAEKEEELRHTVLRHNAEVEALHRKIAVARDAEARERRIRERCEGRLRAEIEGRESDLGLLRQQLRTVEKNLYFGHTVTNTDLPHVPEQRRCARCEAQLAAEGAVLDRKAASPLQQQEKERKAAALIAALMAAGGVGGLDSTTDEATPPRASPPRAARQY